MKKITTFLMLMASLSGFSQVNRAKIDSVRNLVMVAFNEKKPTNIYALTGDDFRKQISEKQIIQVSEMLYTQLGKWKNSEFQKNTNGIVFYKVIFEKGNQSFIIGLDKSDKIATLAFQPYKEVSQKKAYQVASNNAMQTPLDVRVDSLVRPYIQQKNTAGICIAVIKDGKVQTYSYGETKLGEKNLPDADQTLFEIGSISKTFTAILLADAVIKGKMQLNDPISKYLPDSIGKMSYKDAPITLQTLSNHSSGFPSLPANFFQKSDNEANPYQNYDEKRMFTYLKNFKPYREVGVNYDYSNFAVGLLGTILARQNQTSYEQLITDKICQPLQMKNTKIFLQDTDNQRFAQGYDGNGKATSAWDMNTLAGAGGIRSTVNDLVKYVMANMTIAPKQLQEAINLTHKTTFSKAENVVGLGWILPSKANSNLYFHNGGTGGFRSFAGFDKERKIGIVILSNATESVDGIGFGLLK